MCASVCVREREREHAHARMCKTHVPVVQLFARQLTTYDLIPHCSFLPIVDHFLLERLLRIMFDVSKHTNCDDTYANRCRKTWERTCWGYVSDSTIWPVKYSPNITTSATSLDTVRCGFTKSSSLGFTGGPDECVCVCVCVYVRVCVYA